MSKLLALISGLVLVTACSTLRIDRYQANDSTNQVYLHASGTYSVGPVSGATGVQSDALFKSSLPCRLTEFEMPDRDPVSIYIQKALRAELAHNEKLATTDGRRIDIVVNRIESNTSKIHDGTWTLDFSYKIGKVAHHTVTMTPYAFSADSTVACSNTAAAFNEALRENFSKFFGTLH